MKSAAVALRLQAFNFSIIAIKIMCDCVIVCLCVFMCRFMCVYACVFMCVFLSVCACVCVCVCGFSCVSIGTVRHFKFMGPE